MPLMLPGIRNGRFKSFFVMRSLITKKLTAKNVIKMKKFAIKATTSIFPINANKPITLTVNTKASLGVLRFSDT